MYTVRLYYHTGFNAGNCPGSIALLNTFTHSDFDALDLIQARELPQISIRATYDQVKDADYCCLFNNDEAIYYIVDGEGITSDDDTSVIPFIDIDPVLTAGGFSAIEVLDGITERHHVATADDTFGAYTEEDPYLTASKPLELVDAGSYPVLGGGKFIIAQSTARLTQMGFAKDHPLSTKYVQYESGVEISSCDIPAVAPLSHQDRSKTAMEGLGTDSVPGMALFVLNDPRTGQGSVGRVSADGVPALQQIGASDAIKNCYSIPEEYIFNGHPSYFTDNVEDAEGNTNSITEEHIDTITGKSGPVIAGGIPTTGFEYEYAQVHNKRVLYGEMNRYGLIAKATGDSCLYKPEEIFHAGDTKPVVKMFANPAPDGCPYFRYEYLNGENGNPFMNCVTGGVWENAPLIYSDKSGSVLDTLKLEASQTMKRDQFDIEQARAKNLLDAGKGLLIGGSIDAVGNAPLSLAGIAPGTLYSVNNNSAQLLSTINSGALRRARATRQELAMQNIELGISQVVAPTVNFPRSSGLRDYVGNNVFVYRYHPSATDLVKQDKILTMYGYKDTAPLTTAMFSNRSKFNYIKATGVSVKTSMPKWINDKIAQVFATGIRIWHVAPNVACYTDGSNV